MKTAPPTPEQQARIDADFAAKTGPFQYAVLAGYEVADHYGIQCATARELLDKLAAKRVQAALSLYIMDPALRSINGGEVMACYLAKVSATLHDEAALKTLAQPLSRFQQYGGSAETEALILADFRGRTGPFARPILAAADLIDAYGEARFRTNRVAGSMLAQVSFRAQVSQSRGESIRLHVVHDDPRYRMMIPRELLAVYLAAKEL